MQSADSRSQNLTIPFCVINTVYMQEFYGTIPLPNSPDFFITGVNCSANSKHAHFHPLALTGNLCAFVIFSFLQKVGNAPHYLCMLSLKQYTQWLVQMGSKGLRSTYRWLLYLSRGSISLLIFPFSQYSHHDRLVQQVAFHCMNNKFKFYFVAIRALRDKQVFWIIQSHNFGCLCLAFDAHQSWTAFLPELKSSMPFQSLLKP